MCVMGYFVAFEQVGWWWRWMRYIAVHYYSFSTFMTNQYEGNTYLAYCPNPAEFPCYTNNVVGDTLITYYDLESRIWLNFVVMVRPFSNSSIPLNLWTNLFFFITLD